MFEIVGIPKGDSSIAQSLGNLAAVTLLEVDQAGISEGEPLDTLCVQVFKEALIDMRSPTDILAAWIHASETLSGTTGSVAGDAAKLAVIDHVLDPKVIRVGTLQDGGKPRTEADKRTLLRLATAFLDDNTLPALAAEHRAHRLVGETQLGLDVIDSEGVNINHAALEVALSRLERSDTSDVFRHVVYCRAAEYACIARAQGDIELANRACALALRNVSPGRRASRDIPNRVGAVLDLTDDPNIVREGIDMAIASFDQAAMDTTLLEHDQSCVDLEAAYLAQSDARESYRADPRFSDNSRKRGKRRDRGMAANELLRKEYGLPELNERAGKAGSAERSLSAQVLTMRIDACRIMQLAAQRSVALAVAEGGLAVLQSAADLELYALSSSDPDLSFGSLVRGAYRAAVTDLGQDASHYSLEDLKLVYATLRPFFPESQAETILTRI